MSTERDFDRLARAWLELGPDEAPDRVVAAVLQAAETTPQVRRPIRWPFWRLFTMNRLPVAAGAAAVLVVAIGGAVLVSRGGPSTGVGGPPSATPTPSPSPTPSAAPTPISLTNLDAGKQYPAGTYRVGAPFGAPFTFTSVSPWIVRDVGVGEVNLGGGQDENGAVTVDLVQDVFADPCHADSAGGPRPSPVARTVAGVVAGLAEMKGYTMSGTKDIVIDGHAGKEFDLTNTLDPATAGCDTGALIPLWTQVGGARTSSNPGATDHIAIIDVDGIPVAIAWGGNETFKPEVDRLVHGIDFE